MRGSSTSKQLLVIVHQQFTPNDFIMRGSPKQKKARTSRDRLRAMRLAQARLHAKRKNLMRTQAVGLREVGQEISNFARGDVLIPAQIFVGNTRVYIWNDLRGRNLLIRGIDSPREAPRQFLGDLQLILAQEFPDVEPASMHVELNDFGLNEQVSILLEEEGIKQAEDSSDEMNLDQSLKSIGKKKRGQDDLEGDLDPANEQEAVDGNEGDGERKKQPPNSRPKKSQRTGLVKNPGGANQGKPIGSPDDDGEGSDDDEDDKEKGGGGGPGSGRFPGFGASRKQTPLIGIRDPQRLLLVPTILTPKNRIKRDIPVNINLRFGISLNRLNPQKPSKKHAKELSYVYGNFPFAEGFEKTVDIHPQPRVNRLLKNPRALNAPIILESELSVVQIRQIRSVRSMSELQRLLDSYEKRESITPYLAALIHFRNEYKDENTKKKIELLRLILSPPEERGEVDDAILAFSPSRFNQKKVETVKGNMEAVASVLSSLQVNGQSPESMDYPMNQLGQLKQSLTDFMRPDSLPVDLLALSDYQNTLYDLYREVMEKPWKVMQRDQYLVKTVNDSTLEILSTIFAAQRALEQGPVATHIEESPVFRWVNDLEDYMEGGIVSPMALFSTSKGSQATEAFGKAAKPSKDNPEPNPNRTFFVIKNHKTGKFSQILAGTKNWYQREVLFPAYARFIVRAKLVDEDMFRLDRREIWYVLEELQEGLLRQSIPTNIGLTYDDSGSYNMDPVLLRNSLVDAQHLALFDGKPPSRAQLIEAGVELPEGIDIAQVNANNVYGAATHERWARLMKRAVRDRLGLLSLASLQTMYAELMGLSTEHLPPFRTKETGWGNMGYYPTLSLVEQTALQDHGMTFFPTIDQKQLPVFIEWIKSLSPRVKFDSLLGLMNKKEYLAKIEKWKSDLALQKANASAEDNITLEKARMPLSEGMMVSFFNEKIRKNRKEIYDGEKQQYEVSYGVPEYMDNGRLVLAMQEFLQSNLNEISIGLEQNLALLEAKIITPGLYVQNVRRYATDLQQRIAARHPFDDGNGRLSRLMMYKVLQAYYPPEMAEEGLPVIENTGLDLLKSKEAWYADVFRNPGSNVNSTATLLSGGFSDPPPPDDDDDNDDEDDSGPPGFGGFPASKGGKGKGGDKPPAQQSRDRRNAFFTALRQVERVERNFLDPAASRSEPVNISNIGVPIERASRREGFSRSQFTYIDNPGKGDCLFHALEGRTLNLQEVLDLRRDVATLMRENLVNQNSNAMNIIIALVQTGYDGAGLMDFMNGRDNVPNTVYSQMQATPGIYAGDDELSQWARLKGKNVGVVNVNGELRIFKQDGTRETLDYIPSTRASAVQKVLGETDVAIFQTANHFVRIKS